MSDRVNRQFILIVVLLLTFGPGASAKAAAQPQEALEMRSSPAAVVPADGGSVAKVVYGGGRTRIVQICAVAMGIALFILMRKLN